MGDTCTCGGTDIGVGIMHEPHCVLSGTHCPTCKGAGLVPVSYTSSDGSSAQEGEDCGDCKGTGVRRNTLMESLR